MVDILTLQGWLLEAQTALHNLNTGKMAKVFVDQNGERIEYVTANSDKLKLYIRELEQKINAAAGKRPTGPLRVIF